MTVECDTGGEPGSESTYDKFQSTEMVGNGKIGQN